MTPAQRNGAARPSHDADGPWRLFLAVPVGPPAGAALARALDGAALPGRPVARAGWHITLRFLGDVDGPARRTLRAALDATTLGPPFSLELDAIDALPTASRARVIVATVAAGPAATRLGALAAHAEGAARAAGLPPEQRPFRPHVTLARCRPAVDARAVLHRLAARGPLAVPVPVAEVVLLRSHLGPDGARYERVAAFPLASWPG